MLNRAMGDRKPHGAVAGDKVVLVHGLWMTGLELRSLARRLGRCGLDPVLFRYPDLRRAPAENAESLAAFVATLPGDRIHFVGHSLGGILLLHLFDRTAQQRPGRVVLLGTPAGGSEAARRLHGIPLLGSLLGESVRDGLEGGAPAWRAGRDLGVIAGDLGIGAGFLLGGLASPHDGTVAVAETRIPGAAHIRLHVSHFGLLFSPDVARRVCGFLYTGGFDLSPSES